MIADVRFVSGHGLQPCRKDLADLGFSPCKNLEVLPKFVLAMPQSRSGGTADSSPVRRRAAHRALKVGLGFSPD